MFLWILGRSASVLSIYSVNLLVLCSTGGKKGQPRDILVSEIRKVRGNEKKLGACYVLVARNSRSCRNSRREVATAEVKVLKDQ